jgi:hypothetical protein
MNAVPMIAFDEERRQTVVHLISWPFFHARTNIGTKIQIAAAND